MSSNPQQYDPVACPNGTVRFFDCQEVLHIGGRSEWRRKPVYLNLAHMSVAKPYEPENWGKTNGHSQSEPTPKRHFIRMQDGWRYWVQCSPEQFHNLISLQPNQQ